MTVHSQLQPYIEAWTHAMESIFELVSPLPEADWSRPTELPGWSVRDIVSHLIGFEGEATGDPRPIHALPRDLFHVKDDFSRYAEVHVDVRRCHTAPEQVAELDYLLLRRSRQLRNESRPPETQVRWLMGRQATLEEVLRDRAFEVWVHEQDLRRALGVPGNLGSPGSAIARDIILPRLPQVAIDLGLRPYSAVVFDVHGEQEFMRTVRVSGEGEVSIDGSVSLGPAVTLTLDWETFLRLTTGRVKGRVPDRLKVEGDEELADRLLAHLSVTP